MTPDPVTGESSNVALAYTMTDVPLQSQIIETAVADQMVHACSGRSMHDAKWDCAPLAS
jgi:hypothetical protein